MKVGSDRAFTCLLDHRNEDGKIGSQLKNKGAHGIHSRSFELVTASGQSPDERMDDS